MQHEANLKTLILVGSSQSNSPSFWVNYSYISTSLCISYPQELFSYPTTLLVLFPFATQTWHPTRPSPGYKMPDSCGAQSRTCGTQLVNGLQRYPQLYVGYVWIIYGLPSIACCGMMLRGWHVSSCYVFDN